MKIVNQRVPKPIIRTKSVQPSVPAKIHDVLFQGLSPTLNQTVKSIDSNLEVARATPSDKPKILKLLRDFYWGEVNPASANKRGYKGQGTVILNIHEAVIDANLSKVARDPDSELYVVTNSQTGDAVATAALLQSSLNGEHQPPSDAGQVSYFYKAKPVPDAVSLALIEAITEKAKALNLKSLFTTARREGMDDRNQLMQAAGFKEVTDKQRIEKLVPPMLRRPHTVVYEKKLL